MSISAFLAVIFAAVLHASWNAVVKANADKQQITYLVAICSALIAIILIPFFKLPAVESWPYIFRSAGFSTVYFLLLARTYQLADMSQIYPIMRGSAPMIVAIAGTILLSETLTLSAWAGISIICVGILSTAIAVWHHNQKMAIILALLNAMVIATYTLNDGMGVRLSGAPISYNLWNSFFSGLPFLAWVLLRRRAEFLKFSAENWRLGFVGGMGAMSAYGLALWAMLETPIALVSALRETSIIFATMIAWYVFKEKIDRVRLFTIFAIFTGVIIIKLS